MRVPGLAFLASSFRSSTQRKELNMNPTISPTHGFGLIRECHTLAFVWIFASIGGVLSTPLRAGGPPELDAGGAPGRPKRQMAAPLTSNSIAWAEYERRLGVPLFTSVAAGLPSTVAPTARDNHAMAYDSGRAVTVLFGGWATIGVDMYEQSAETWEWDGNAWTLRDTGGGPDQEHLHGRIRHAMAYDSTRGVTVLFGGWGYVFDGVNTWTEGYSPETWEWDGATWTRRSVTGPSGRTRHEMVFDSARGRTVLFGGSNDSGLLADTWEWDGGTWVLKDPGSSTVGPVPRRQHAMAYDSARGVTVLFGGYTESGGTYLYSRLTWEWDGQAWTLRHGSEPGGPVERVNHTMAYDSARGVTVLFCGWGTVPTATGSEYGYLHDTWEWDGAGWTLRSPVVVGLFGLVRHDMTFDGARGRTVVFGGSNDSGDLVGDTWEWDGTAWTLEHQGVPDCLTGADCSDGNPCTDDICTAGECSNVNNTAPCDDGTECTTSSVCFDGYCTGTDYVPHCAPRMFASVVAINGVPNAPLETVDVVRGDEVTLDVFIENWSSNIPERTLRTAQGSIDTAGFASGSAGSLALLNDPTGDAGLFQDLNRADWVFPGVGVISACDVSSTGPRCFALVDDEANCRADPGVPVYLFTAVLVVSNDATGTFTVAVGRPYWDSFLADCTIPPVTIPVEPGSVEIRAGADCNANQIVDSRDLADHTSADCNANTAPDECDIASEFSLDLNTNGIPDDCEVAPSAVPDPSGINTNRSLVFSVQPPATAGTNSPTAIRVTMTNLNNPSPPNATCCPPPDFGVYESATCNPFGEMNACARWVGKPGTFLESQNNPALGGFKAARLQCTPYYHDWGAEGLLHVVGAEILASSTYEVVHFAAMCVSQEDTCTAVSAPLTIRTARFGDVAAPFNPPSPTAQPDGNDVLALVNKFKNLPGAPSKSSGQIYGNAIELNLDVGGLDVSAAVDAFKGLAYPYSGPCPCPSSVTCNATACGGAAQCSGGLCTKTCTGGINLDQPCLMNAQCPGSSCGAGFCRDRCGRCR